MNSRGPVPAHYRVQYKTGRLVRRGEVSFVVGLGPCCAYQAVLLASAVAFVGFLCRGRRRCCRVAPSRTGSHRLIAARKRRQTLGAKDVQANEKKRRWKSTELRRASSRSSGTHRGRAPTLERPVQLIVRGA